MSKAKKLTSVSVEKIRPPSSGRECHFDSLVPSFCLRVSSSGAKSWCVFLRVSGRQRLMTLGRYPSLSLSEARDDARRAIRATQKGLDPVEELKRLEIETLRQRKSTFASVLKDYLEDIRHVRTHREITRIFEKYVAHWNTMPIRDISRRDVIELRDTVKRKHGGYMANNVLSAIRALFNWALDRDIVEFSPCQGVKRAIRPKPRDRVLRGSEIKGVWDAAEELAFPFGRAVQLLFATGQRLGEVSAMRWSDFDLDDTVWLLSAEQTKSGRRHEVPLNRVALEILESLPQLDDEYVFNSGRGTHIKGWSKAAAQLYELAELNESWRLHDIRRTVSSIMRERLGIPIDVIAGVNNHAPTSVTERHYARRVGLEDKRVALEKWAAYLTRTIEGRDETIVPFEGRASSR